MFILFGVAVLAVILLIFVWCLKVTSSTCHKCKRKAVWIVWRHLHCSKVIARKGFSRRYAPGSYLAKIPVPGLFCGVHSKLDLARYETMPRYAWKWITSSIIKRTGQKPIYEYTTLSRELIPVSIVKTFFRRITKFNRNKKRQ